MRSTTHLEKYQSGVHLAKITKRSQVVRQAKVKEKRKADTGRMDRLFAFMARSDAEYARRKAAGLLHKTIPSVQR